VGGRIPTHTVSDSQDNELYKLTAHHGIIGSFPTFETLSDVLSASSGGYNDQAQVPRAWTASSVFTVLRSAISAATLGQRLRTQSSAFPGRGFECSPHGRGR
jgi:hypothetical protein